MMKVTFDTNVVGPNRDATGVRSSGTAEACSFCIRTHISDGQIEAYRRKASLGLASPWHLQRLD
jgi:hypothetical protein